MLTLCVFGLNKTQLLALGAIKTCSRFSRRQAPESPVSQQQAVKRDDSDPPREKNAVLTGLSGAGLDGLSVDAQAHFRTGRQ